MRRPHLVLLAVVLATMVWATTVATADGLQASEGPLGAIAATAWSLVPLIFALCGSLIVRRQPSNWVGWLLVVPGVAVLQELMPILDRTNPPTSLGPVDVAQLWFNNISWMLLIFPVFHLLQVFPDGSLVSRKWRAFVSLEVTMVVSLAALALFFHDLGPLDGPWSAPNPIGFITLDFVEGVFTILWAVGLTVLTIGSLFAVAVRFRRGGRTERQQIKWLLLAVSIFAVVYIAVSANEAWQGQGFFDLVLVFSLIGIPLSILISVTRYHLYEIDRIISRTVSYVLVISLLGLVYGALAAVVGSRFDDSLVVAGSTLTVAALFRPLRSRIQRAVDRRFNRSQFDAEMVIQDFTRSLSVRGEPGAFMDEWLGVVSQTMGPDSAGVWVRGSDRD